MSKHVGKSHVDETKPRGMPTADVYRFAGIDHAPRRGGSKGECQATNVPLGRERGAMRRGREKPCFINEHAIAKVIANRLAAASGVAVHR
jgi:hypothetical protein